MTQTVFTGGIVYDGTTGRPADGDVVVEEGRIVEVATAAGIHVMAHAQGAGGIKAALRNGVRSVERGIFLGDSARAVPPRRCRGQPARRLTVGSPGREPAPNAVQAADTHGPQTRCTIVHHEDGDQYPHGHGAVLATPPSLRGSPGGAFGRCARRSAPPLLGQLVGRLTGGVPR
ncbi:MAG: putative Imidazolonepropionase [Marmoricola sp.]|nr:putative Imidazolonepropionase [Marmoricola sp.]